MDSENFPTTTKGRVGDPFLQLLVFLAGGRSGISFGIVLVVEGNVITGTAVSRSEWMNQWREELEQAGSGGQIIANAIRQADEEESYIHEDEVSGDLPRRVHLRNARVENGSNPMLMRVELASVSAWSMGGAPPRAALIEG